MTDESENYLPDKILEILNDGPKAGLSYIKSIKENGIPVVETPFDAFSQSLRELEKHHALCRQALLTELRIQPELRELVHDVSIDADQRLVVYLNASRDMPHQTKFSMDVEHCPRKAKELIDIYKDMDSLLNGVDAHQIQVADASLASAVQNLLRYNASSLELCGSFPSVQEPGGKGKEGVFLYFKPKAATAFENIAEAVQKAENPKNKPKSIEKSSLILDTRDDGTIQLYVDINKLGDEDIAVLARGCIDLSKETQEKLRDLDACWKEIKQKYPDVKSADRELGR